MTRHLSRAAAALALTTLTSTLVPLMASPVHAADDGAITGINIEYDYNLGSTSRGCGKDTYASISMVLPGTGKAFADTEYADGWEVVFEVAGMDEDAEPRGTVSTDDVYASTYGGEKSLNVRLECKAAGALMDLGYGTGEEIRLTVASAEFDGGRKVLDTSEASELITPLQVPVIEPQKAKKKGKKFRIASQVLLWSATDDGYAWAAPGRAVEVIGLWKSCPYREVESKDNGKFTVTWKRSAMLNGKNFGYSITESKKVSSFDGGWVRKSQAKFIPTESYYNGCGGA